jgi:hypothetical protein
MSIPSHGPAAINAAFKPLLRPPAVTNIPPGRRPKSKEQNRGRGTYWAAPARLLLRIGCGPAAAEVSGRLG